jgi:hypothetical protein
VRTPQPGSFTALDKFKNCPKAFYEIRVLKNFKDEQGEAALWGDQVHKQIEAFITHCVPMPETMGPIKDRVYSALMHIGRLTEPEATIHAELKLALNTKVGPCDWFDKKVWARGIVDLIKIKGNEAWVVDWKTGKIKPDSRQLKLFALMTFYHFGHVSKVHTIFEWLAHGGRTEEVYTSDQIPALWDEFMPDLIQYKDAFKNDEWPARKSGLCKEWCAVMSCKFNGRG